MDGPTTAQEGRADASTPGTTVGGASSRPGTATTREACVARDAADPLAFLRERFDLPDGTIYLDGNSLGALPRATAARLADVVTREWGRDLIASWNSAGWIDAPRRIGDAIAPLVGAQPGEIVVADSTSINLFKVLSVALALVNGDDARRTVVLSEADNFPTDLYIAEGATARLEGGALRLVAATAPDARAAAIVDAVDGSTAVLMLTHVNYRSGAMHDMRALTRAAHDAGALVVWDLAHSAGAVPVDLHAADADFAIGCGYKYLNGGPGAPAFVWVHPRHLRRLDERRARQPLSGWFGHADPFAFESSYAPAPGIARFLCGTPPMLSMTALECGVASLANDDGGFPIDALRAKSTALTTLFIERVEAVCGDALELVTPRDPARRGSQVSFHARGPLAGHGYATMQALIDRGVVGDFRKAAATGAACDRGNDDILRFGFTPAYLRHVDAFDAAAIIADVVASGAWREPRFSVAAAVT